MAAEREALRMLREEHRFVDQLLERLAEIGRQIQAGTAVSPKSVRFGVGLLDAYLHRVHARQFDVEMWPAANSVAGPECRAPLDLVRSTHTRLRESVRGLLDLAARWAGGDKEAGARLAEGMIRLAATDDATNRFEESHPFVCLGSALSAGTDRRLAAAFRDHSGTKGALEANIRRFLEAPTPAR